LKSHNAEAFRMAAHIMIAACGLDRALECFSAGIGEKDLVGESAFDKTPPQLFLRRNFVNVGQMPELVSLRLQRFHQMRMRMTKRVHSNARREIEITFTAFGNKPDALTSLEAQSRTIIGVVKRLHGRSVGHSIRPPKPILAVCPAAPAKLCLDRKSVV